MKSSNPMLSLLLAFSGLAAAFPQPLLASINDELALNITKGLQQPSDLVFGGLPAHRGQWPWQVFLLVRSRQGGEFICGGSLLSKRHVLTAAHCTEDLVSPSLAMVGLVNIDSASWTPGVQIKNIVSYINHAGFTNAGSLYDDISIMTLDSDVILSEYVKVVKIKADDSALVQEKKDTVSGFGTYTFQGKQPISSPNLLYAEVDHVDFERCKRRWAQITGYRTNIWSKQICAGSNGRGSGPGDSGGPLQVRAGGDWYQIGLVSFGISSVPEMKNQAEYPAVYTRVSKYCDFIERNAAGFKCL